MGVRIIAKGLDAESYATEYASPVRRALEAIHFLNTSVEKSARNYAPGKSTLQGSVVGTPTVGSGYLRCTGLSNFIQTGVAETRNGTMFVIGRNLVDDGAVANRTMLAGTYKGAGAPLPGGSGVGFYAGSVVARLNGLSHHATNDAATSTLSVATIQVVPLTTWALMMLSFSDNKVVCRNLSVPYTASTTPPTPRRVVGDKMRIGSGYTSYTGVCDVAAFQYHSEVLTEEEIQLVAADLRAYALRKGITV